MNDASIRALARALCDTSDHTTTAPPPGESPCAYHQERARTAAKLLFQRGLSLGFAPTTGAATRPN